MLIVANVLVGMVVVVARTAFSVTRVDFPKYLRVHTGWICSFKVVYTATSVNHPFF